MRSIKKRLTLNFMVIVLVTVLTLEAILLFALRNNYYKNLENSLLNQIKVSASLYERYFSGMDMEELIANNIDMFYSQTSAQVQIYSKNGFLLLDSSGSLEDKEGDDIIKEVLKGKSMVFKGRLKNSKGNVIAISYPLKKHDSVDGVLRFITSTSLIDSEIRRIGYIFAALGLIVIFISGIISFFLAGSIVEPLKDVTHAAETMAGGNFNIKSPKRVDDEIGRLSDVLNFMAREIVEKEKLKNEFISSVSHELRTPLTSIKGWAITLKNIDIEDKKTRFDGLDIIEKESDRLTSMVEELLDFSKFLSNKITLKKERVDIKETLIHLKKQLTERANREGKEFTLSFEGNMPITISDENRLKQVLINILDNAFNFTPEGGKVSINGKFKGGNFIISIKDTGCGISEGDIPRIKEKFYKGKNSKSQNGIGLSICDEIVRLMKGNLEIKSKLNEGTEVIITLPVCGE